MHFCIYFWLRLDFFLQGKLEFKLHNGKLKTKLGFQKEFFFKKILPNLFFVKFNFFIFEPYQHLYHLTLHYLLNAVVYLKIITVLKCKTNNGICQISVLLIKVNFCPLISKKWFLETEPFF